MKKTFIIIFIGFSNLLSLKAQASFQVEMGYGRTPCGGGGGICRIESKNDLLEGSSEKALYTSVFLDKLNRANFKIPKSSLNSELTVKEFEGKYMLYLEEDLPLTDEHNRLEKPLILAHGWHPIIELEDSYIISYTLKQ